MSEKQTKDEKQENNDVVSATDEMKRLTDFFSILIAIDQRTKNNTYAKTEK